MFDDGDDRGAERIDFGWGPFSRELVEDLVWDAALLEDALRENGLYPPEND